MICVITGEETKSQTRGVPLSREGRTLLKDVVKFYNEKVKDDFVKGMSEALEESGRPYTVEDLEKNSPRLSSKTVLKSIQNKDKDTMSIVKTLLGEEDEKLRKRN